MWGSGWNLISGGVGVDYFWIVDIDFINFFNVILDFELGIDIIGFKGLVFC